VARWRASDPRHSLLLTHVEAAWLPEPAPDGDAPDVEAMSQAVMTAIAIPPYQRQHHVANQTADRRPKFVTPSERRRAFVPWLAGAMACLLIAGGAMLTRAHRVNTTAQSTAGRHYATTRGERATIRLPDGSSVILGYASTLTVPQDFGGRTRQLQVTGQAAFTVAPDRSAPFVVSVGNARTEVLGTSFIVQKYSNDATARVLVTEGRVSLRPLDDRQLRNNTNPVAILSAHMLGEVSDSGRVTAVPATADDNLADWTLDRIAFRATPLRDVIPALERVYDVDIRITDSTLLDLHVTLAAMPDKTPVAETLDTR